MQQEVNYQEQIENELSMLRSQNMNLNKQTYDMQNQMMNTTEGQNLIQWQLDLQNDFERIKHVLRGDIVVTDKEGNQFWEQNKDELQVPLNDYGVNMLMRILYFYVNRNTLLAYYEPEEIQQIVGQASAEINDNIYFNLAEYGMDSPKKRKHIAMIHLALQDFILSAYKRAQYGGERDSLRTARHVTQSDNSMNPQRMGGQGYNQTPQKSFSLFRPSTWKG